MRQTIFHKTSACAVAALALIVFASPSFAQGRAGGTSGTHMSTQGSANTNGPNATDRDKGRARAQDRSSSQGQTHSKAGTKGKADTK